MKDVKFQDLKLNLYGPADFAAGEEVRLYVAHASGHEIAVREGRVVDPGASKHNTTRVPVPALRVKLRNYGTVEKGRLKLWPCATAR
jgi:hypothetical protein